MNPALIALFLGAFCVGTTEFVPAGLIPEIATDLNVSIPLAGLLISGYAAGVAVGGPIVSLLTSRFPRKPMILALMGLFVAGHVFAALAPNYPLLMLARIVISLSHGSYFGLMAIITMSLVPPERQGAAIAFTFAGISVANVIGVPLGTFIGGALGWRATFWVVGGLGILAAIAMAVFVPSRAATQHKDATLADQFRVLGKPQVYMTYAMIVVMMVGFFSLVTFVSPWLTIAGNVPAALIPGVLLLFGAGATIGIFIGGRLNDWRQNETLLWSFAFQFAVFVLLLLAPGKPLLAVLGLFCVGLTNINNAPIQTRILRGAAAAPDLASTLISSVYNTGIAIGAWLGATAIDNGIAYAQIPWFGIGTSIFAGLICVATLAWERRRRMAAA